MTWTILVILLVIFAALWIYSGQQKRKFEAEQRKLRKERRKHLEDLKAKKAKEQTQSNEEE